MNIELHSSQLFSSWIIFSDIPQLSGLGILDWGRFLEAVFLSGSGLASDCVSHENPLQLRIHGVKISK